MSSHDRDLLIRDVALDGGRVDCRVVAGIVAEIGPGLTPQWRDRVVDGAGGALLPGLHDHHVHPFAAAAADGSLDLRSGPLPSPGHTTASGPDHTWVRAIGLGDDDATAGDLDRVWPGRPARVQHRSGALWVLNTRAIRLLEGVLEPAEQLDGRVWRGDARLAEALGRLDPRGVEDDLREWGERLAARGLTGLTDATAGLAPSGLAVVRAHVPQRVVSLGAEDDGLPVKVIAGDHGVDTWSTLGSAVRAARERGRPVAVHAVSATALAMVLAVLDEVGVVAGDRVEHAAVCDDDTADRLAELGVIVVTQPSIAARRGRRMMDSSDPEDRPWLWRIAGLRDRGVPVVLSSDAPYGDPDPWATIRLATVGLPVDRSPWRHDQTIPARVALASYLTRPEDPAGPVRRVQPGVPADLCVLDAPLDAVLDRVVAGDVDSPVCLTVIDGRVVSTRPGCSAADA